MPAIGLKTSQSPDRGKSSAPRRRDISHGPWFPLQQWAESHPRLAFALAWLALLAAICCARFGVIDSPPYYDFATGLFLEANFLAESNFDYAALAQQSRWLEGGPAVYVVSVMPTLIAVLMKMLPAPAVLVAYHLFNFGCAAAAGVLMFSILRPYAGAPGAALTGLLLLTAPLFSTQIDMLGMDLPLAAAALAAVWSVANERYVGAACWALVAGLVKVPGRAVSIAVVLYLVALLALSWNERSVLRRRLWLGLGANLLVVGFQDFVSRWLSELPQSETENWSFAGKFYGNENMLNWTPIWFPDQVAVFLVSLVVALCVATALARQALRQPGWRATVSAFRTAWRRCAPFIVGWIISLGMLTALAIVYCLPRYFLLILPMTYLTFGAALFCLERWRFPAGVFVSLLILFNIANAYGRFYPRLPEAGRTGAILERSREALVDHASNIRAVQRLARDYADRPIVSSAPFTHFLGLPRLGYVERPLHGYSLNRFTTPTFVTGMRLPDDLPRDVVFISVNNPFRGNVPPFNPSWDEKIYDDGQPSPLVMFERRWPAGMSDDQLRAEYEKLVKPSKALLAEANDLARQGKYSAAIETYQRALALSPYDAEIHFGLGFALLQQGQYARAIASAREAIRRDEDFAPAYGLLGAALASANEYDEALPVLATAVEKSPRDPGPWATMGRIHFKQARFSEAGADFQKALAIQPNNLPWQYLLAQSLENAGRAQEAVAAYDKALAMARQMNQQELADEIESKLSQLRR